MNKKDLTRKVRSAILFILQNTWKLAGWKLWLILKIWDFLWEMFIFPFMRREYFYFDMRRKIMSRQKVWERAKETTTGKDFLYTMREIWKDRKPLQ